MTWCSREGSREGEDHRFSPAQQVARQALLARCAAGEFDLSPLPDRQKHERREDYERALSARLVLRYQQERHFFEAILEASGLAQHRSRVRILHYLRDQTRGQKREDIIDAFFCLAEILIESME